MMMSGFEDERDLEPSRDVALLTIANDTSKDGQAFRTFSAELRGDRDIVLATVLKHGHCLKYA
jgi:hypothetical protein